MHLQTFATEVIREYEVTLAKNSLLVTLERLKSWAFKTLSN